MVAGRRVKLAALAAGTAALLAGCGLQPGTAATVGSESISHERVDDLARAMCAETQSAAQPAPATSTRSNRENAVGFLVGNELVQRFGESEGVELDSREVSEGVATFADAAEQLPEDLRETYLEAVRNQVESQLVLVEVGQQSLGADTEFQEAGAEGYRLLQEYAQDVDVEVDPRYGTFENGVFVAGGSSLSVPASELAVAGAEEQPGDAYIDGLPASQLCR